MAYSAPIGSTVNFDLKGDYSSPFNLSIDFVVDNSNSSSFDVTLDDASVAFSATSTSVSNAIIDVTFDDVTANLSATFNTKSVGTFSSTFDDANVTFSAKSTSVSNAIFDVTFDDVTANLSATFNTKSIGTFSSTFDDASVTFAAKSTSVSNAIIDVTFDDVTANLSATFNTKSVGTFSSTFDDANVTFSAKSFTPNRASFSLTLDNISANFSATVVNKVVGHFDFVLDDAIAQFSAQIPATLTAEFHTIFDNVEVNFIASTASNFAKIDFVLDDCVGLFFCKYDVNVTRSLFCDVNSAVKNAIPTQINTPLSQFDTSKTVITGVLNQIPATPQNITVDSALQNTISIPVEAHLAIESATLSAIEFNAPSEQLLPTNKTLRIETDTANKLTVKTISDYQDLIKIGNGFKAVFDDVKDKLHVFSYRYVSETPLNYRYNPTGIFEFGTQPNSRLFSDNLFHYVPKRPVNFNLVETISTHADFDLGLIDVELIPPRLIFDSISTYTPSFEFVAPFIAENYVLTESIQRGGFRFVGTAIVSKAVNAFTKRCFKYQNALPKWNERALPHDGSIIDPPRPPPIVPPNHTTITIPTKQVYKMNHILSCVLENSTTVIDVSDIKLTLNSDSYAWGFSCNLVNLTQLSLVKQSIDSMPVVLVITIDNYVFKMLVETIVRTRQFAENSVTLSGRSLSALLSQPYEQPRSATQSSLMTVQQLAELELPSGWTINWTAPTWNVPSGAFSYTAKTPIQVITEIATSIGAIVVPSQNEKVLNIMPRYSVLPWNFDATNPDLVIPDAAIVSLSYRNIVPTQANAVYIHGSELGGVLSRCRLNSTAGDKLTATVNNALMTDVIGTRALGETILANNYEQPAIQSISLKLGGDYPLVKIGDFVRINVDGGQVRGVVNSVSIDANLESVNQTIQIGNESTSIWNAFKDVLPSNPLLVGTIASVDGQTSLITLIDGGVIRCRGVGSIGEKWYIRANNLESKAPSLELSEIVI